MIQCIEHDDYKEWRIGDQTLGYETHACCLWHALLKINLYDEPKRPCEDPSLKRFIFKEGSRCPLGDPPPGADIDLSLLNMLTQP